MEKYSRRVFFGLAAAPVGWSLGIEPYLFEVTETRVDGPGLPKLRILHLTDLHVSDGMTARELEYALDLGLERKPDIVCFTGDYVSSTSGYDAGGLARLLKKSLRAAPTYTVMGNHDGGFWLGGRGGESSSDLVRTQIERTGVEMLHNRSVQVGGLSLIGVGDLASRELRPREAFEEVPEEGPRVVLCHTPDGKDSLRDYRWDLMLSGHTHGGQVCWWPIGDRFAPVFDRRFISGLYDWEGRNLYVSRGTGSPKHVRAGCRPEVAMLELGPPA